MEMIGDHLQPPLVRTVEASLNEDGRLGNEPQDLGGERPKCYSLNRSESAVPWIADLDDEVGSGLALLGCENSGRSGYSARQVYLVDRHT